MFRWESIDIPIKAGTDHDQHSNLCAVYDTGTFYGRGISLLRIKCIVQQHDYGGSEKLKNPNGLILGTPGSGKSFAAKREITNAFLLRRR